jgi:hypothetical protein
MSRDRIVSKMAILEEPAQKDIDIIQLAYFLGTFDHSHSFYTLLLFRDSEDLAV